MNQLDQKIRTALSQTAESADVAANVQPSLMGDVADALNTRMRWLFVFAWIKGSALFAGFVYCAWQFFGQQTTMGMVGYAAGAIICILAVGLIDCIWILMTQHHATQREIKRLELQIALLSKSLEQSS